MSGESLTKGSSRSFPRSTGVMAYFGDAILLADTIVYFSGQYSAVSNSQLFESFFGPEAITHAALFRFALPMMVPLFMLQMFGRGLQPKANEDLSSASHRANMRSTDGLTNITKDHLVED